MKVTAQVRKLYHVLSCIPPDFEMAETLIAKHRPSEEEMMWLAVELAENTFGEYGDALVGGNLSAAQVRLHRCGCTGITYMIQYIFCWNME